MDFKTFLAKASNVPMTGNQKIAEQLRHYADIIEGSKDGFQTAYILSTSADSYHLHSIGVEQKLTEFIGLLEACKLHTVIVDTMAKRSA